MKIVIVSNDGEVLDSTEISREDWLNLSPLGAYTALRDLSVGNAE